jgi:hypothetical protein
MDDEEDTCYECGGQLEYLWTCANGDVCVCKECGEEGLYPSPDDEDEGDDDS